MTAVEDTGQVETREVVFDVAHVTLRFGGVVSLNDVSLQARDKEFLALLERSAIERLIDVRAFPGSRRYPHFSRDALATTIKP